MDRIDTDRLGYVLVNDSGTFKNKFIDENVRFQLNKTKNTGYPVTLSFHSIAEGSYNDPIINIRDRNVPMVLIDCLNTTGVSFNIMPTYAPKVTLYHAQGEDFKCIHLSHRGNTCEEKMANSSAEIKLLDAHFTTASIAHGGQNITIVSGSFGSIVVSSASNFKMSGTVCDDIKLLGYTDSTARIEDCTIYKYSTISGSLKELIITDTDLSHVDIDAAVDVMNIRRCIGNGTTVKHLSIGDLFINWTATRLFVSYNGNEPDSLPLSRTNQLTGFLPTIGYGTEAGWVVDYILDHPATPMNGE